MHPGALACQLLPLGKSRLIAVMCWYTARCQYNVCPNGLLVTTVDGRFDARGMPARPREQSDTGLDKHPLRTPSLNVALRVQRCPRSLTCTSARSGARRPARSKIKNGDEEVCTPPFATLRPGVQRGTRCMRPAPLHRQSREHACYASSSVSMGTPLARASNVPSTVAKSRDARRSFMLCIPACDARCTYKVCTHHSKQQVTSIGR